MTSERVAEVVMAGYVEHGKPMSKADIAERAGRTVATVRRAFQAEFGIIPGVDNVDGQVPVYEKNYTTIVRYRKVDCHVPSREAMAEIIRGFMK